jgi:hypothetical protein
VLITPVLGAPFWDRPPCEVCRLGAVSLACLYPRGCFMVCIWCAQNLAAANVIRIALNPSDDDELAEALA